MTEKLQKILAQIGFGSRRKMEQWIEAGRVSVNQQVAKLGDRVNPQAYIEVDGQPIDRITPKTQLPLVLLYHKPTGEICTRSDPQGRSTVFDRLPLLPKGRWIMVGRLDYYTSGLLLFTNDGMLANRLMHPASHLIRTYAVRLYGTASESILFQLQQGVLLEDGKAHFDTIIKMGGEGKNHWYKVSIKMGRNRIVRRLWESQHLHVNKLIRIGFGPLKLPTDLPKGEWLQLTTHETKQAFF